MAFANGYKSLSFEDIMKEISEEALLEYYFDVTKIPCVIKSPLREDNHPSFGLFYVNDKVGYFDFASGDKGALSNLLIKYLKCIHIKDLCDKLSLELDNIKKIDRYIVKKNIKKQNINDVGNSTKKKQKNSLGGVTLNVRVREWEEYDIEFWKQFGISKEWLSFGKIYPISHLQINGRTRAADKYAYCYVEFKDGKSTLKIYQPFSEKLKWLNNHGVSVWDLWEQAINSDSDSLIITSSRKDALCLWENINIPSVSLQAEGYLPKPQVIGLLYQRFNHIYCLYDNDFDKKENHGREYGKKMCELYPFIKQIEIPTFYKSKDPSDLYKNFGETIFKQVITDLIKN